MRRPVTFLLSISIEGIKIAVFKELDKLALFFFFQKFLDGYLKECQTSCTAKFSVLKLSFCALCLKIVSSSKLSYGPKMPQLN